MKILLNQEVQDEFGYPISVNNLPPMTLRDIVTNSLLTPIREEEEKVKLEKWELFKKIRDEKEEVDLKSEEIALIKKLIAKFQPQLIMGECHEMLENKYVRFTPIPGHEPIKEDGNVQSKQ